MRLATLGVPDLSGRGAASVLNIGAHSHVCSFTPWA